MNTRTTSRARVALMGALLASAAGCGAHAAAELGGTSTVEGTDTAVTVTHDQDQPVVVIRGNDYSFDDVAEAIPARSRLDLRNVSATELHELVAFRLPDDEARSVTELVFLPREELDAVLGAPVAVLLQAPGEPVLAAVGNGTLSEPGCTAQLRGGSRCVSRLVVHPSSTPGEGAARVKLVPSLCQSEGVSVLVGTAPQGCGCLAAAAPRD